MRALAFALVLALAGCAARSAPAAPPPGVEHLVLFTLADPADAAALLEECRRVGALPGVLSASAGTPLEVGRPEARGGWHVAFRSAFRDEVSYAAWREHPEHLAAIARWKPRIARLEVIDWRP